MKKSEYYALIWGLLFLAVLAVLAFSCAIRDDPDTSTRSTSDLFAVEDREAVEVAVADEARDFEGCLGAKVDARITEETGVVGLFHGENPLDDAFLYDCDELVEQDGVVYVSFRGIEQDQYKLQLAQASEPHHYLSVTYTDVDGQFVNETSGMTTTSKIPGNVSKLFNNSTSPVIAAYCLFDKTGCRLRFNSGGKVWDLDFITLSQNIIVVFGGEAISHSTLNISTT